MNRRAGFGGGRRCGFPGGLIVAVLAVSFTAVASVNVRPAQAAISAIDLVTPPGSVRFGFHVHVLTNGNYVIADPYADDSRGAVRLYDGANNALISTLRGSTPLDLIGWDGIVEVGQSNFIVSSQHWHNGPTVGAGAVTWVNGTTGLEGAVSPGNSLVGTSTDDHVGSSNTTVLTNGNYVVSIPAWGTPANLGAITWGSGSQGVAGPVSAANSLTGSHDGDLSTVVVVQVANSNAAVKTPSWDSPTANDVGAVTWINGATGITGPISGANSLVGTTVGDLVGVVLTVLTNGNYVVGTPSWDNGMMANVGAATWVDGTHGLTGPVSTANSLVGLAGDQISNAGITALTNGNYVVRSDNWYNGPLVGAGAATWGNGATGTTGVVSAANSIHGTYLLDSVGSVTALANGNYVVSSPMLDINGKQDVGGAMWASGGGPTAAAMSDSNSIIGQTAGDHVGTVTSLTNGNYVVQSDWQTGGVAVGASTWASGTEPSAFAVNETNSLVNAQAGDNGNTSILRLTNGNYLVRALYWANGGLARAGAVTWGSGTSGVVGVVSAANSVVGTGFDDLLGIVAAPLPNGNALIGSPLRDSGMTSDAGIIRVISGSGPTTGPADHTNSLVGTHGNDRVGGSIRVLDDGNAVTLAGFWDNGALADVGAVTWLSATGGPTGLISASNSLIGSLAGDQVGNGNSSLLHDGAFVFESAGIDNGGNLNAGAVTYLDPGGAVGTLSASNSVFGEQPGQGGQMELGGRYTKADGVVIGRPIDNKVTVILTRDKTPPSFAPTANVIVRAAPGAQSAVVNYPLPAASDARSTPTVACVPPPGSTFPIGMTTVTCTATDAVGLSATTTFTVTVTLGDYVPLSPARLADTRQGFTTIDGIEAGGGQRGIASTLELQVAGRGGVSSDASAVTLNVTAVDAVAPGYATAWPCGETRPTASNLNFDTGATVPNAVIAKVGVGGKVCLFTSQPIHFVVDVNGYAPATTSYRPLNPARLLDTRVDGITVDGNQRAVGAVGAESSTTLQVTGRGGVPADATSVVLNLTTTESSADGYITAHPCGSQRPNASSVNGVTGSTVANLVISKIGAGGAVCLYSQSPTHLIADVNGYFAPGGSYIPLVPARLMDTRPGADHPTIDGQAAGTGLVPLGSVTPLQITGRGGVPGASTVVLNVTVTEPGAAGYVSAYPCGPTPGESEPPNASNLNYAAGQTVANAALVKIGTGGTVCLYNSQPTQLVVDVTGYFPD